MATAADRRMAALAAGLAGRLALDLARAGTSSAGGVGRLEAGRADRCSGDVDVDRSLDGLLEAKAAGRPWRLEELWVQRWQRPATAIALVVDRSGSMGGPRLAAAAVAAAACALRAPQQWSALAFGDQVVAIKSADSDRPASAVVDDILRLRGYGTTDLAAALDAGPGPARALHRPPPRRGAAVGLPGHRRGRSGGRGSTPRRAVRDRARRRRCRRRIVRGSRRRPVRGDRGPPLHPGRGRDRPGKLKWATTSAHGLK